MAVRFAASKVIFSALAVPQTAAPTQAIKLRLHPDVLAYFRNKGWQTRINATLRRAARLKKTG
jgi:uncharacterized protein (DUF4415 family)